MSGGVDANRDIIEAVYGYYADLYLDNPGMLWAGMAALMGPSFYGGFQDLDTFADLADDAGRLLQAASLFPTTLLPPGVEGSLEQLAALGAEDLEREFRFFEQTFLSMQREIFLDQGTAHEAYLDGGMFAIEALFADDPWGYGPQTIDAWQQIDDGLTTGNFDQVAAGNRALLLREQRRVIDDDYARMDRAAGHRAGHHLPGHPRGDAVGARRPQLPRGLPPRRHAVRRHRHARPDPHRAEAGGRLALELGHV